MGKLCEMSDGNYLLEVKIGDLLIVKAFGDADVTLDEVSKVPMPDGFYLYIPDIKADNSDED